VGYEKGGIKYTICNGNGLFDKFKIVEYGEYKMMK
jgi:hypothetical protein